MGKSLMCMRWRQSIMWLTEVKCRPYQCCVVSLNLSALNKCQINNYPAGLDPASGMKFLSCLPKTGELYMISCQETFILDKTINIRYIFHRNISAICSGLSLVLSGSEMFRWISMCVSVLSAEHITDFHQATWVTVICSTSRGISKCSKAQTIKIADDKKEKIHKMVKLEKSGNTDKNT